MKINLPKVTVVTVTYNAKAYLEQTLESVIEQDYPNIEYIIIDGASTDGTINIIKQYEKYLTYWISEPDRGIYDAMNKGIQAATGEWINFMNAGDSFAAKDVLKQIFQTNQEADILYSDSFIVDNNKKVLRRANVKGLESLLLPEMPFIHQSSLIKRSIIINYLFRTDYSLASDIDLFMKLYVKKYKFKYLKEIVIANFLIGGIHTLNMVKYIAEATNSLISEHPNIISYSKDLGVIKAFENLNNQAVTFFPSLLSSLLINIEQVMQQYDKVILYGYGMLGKVIYSHYDNKIVAVADKFLIADEELKNLPIIGINEINHFEYDVIIISLLHKENSIISDLEQYGIPKSKIVSLSINVSLS